MANMSTEFVVALVAAACSCSEADAKEYIESEVQNLSELAAVNDLRHSDVEEACKSLGLDYDYVEYFIECLANGGANVEVPCDDYDHMPFLAEILAQ